jgi:hypothetical protein
MLAPEFRLFKSHLNEIWDKIHTFCRQRYVIYFILTKVGLVKSDQYLVELGINNKYLSSAW